MAKRGFIRQRGFWPLALLWLPAGVAVTAALRFASRTEASPEPDLGLAMVLVSVGSLVPVALCGLPLALGCRQLWRLGYTRAAWITGLGLGGITVAATLVAGLLGPIAIALYATGLSLPVWVAWWWLAGRR
ncbi:hypothetical protein [Nitratireductor sp. XY-223]|uniref:hypothetical protein n=1 Tax=Nitratireductor sp. XY-223 TaxID=2561926 RepID=UPI0010A9FA79|nr:hypothetical protein [Nitratireductor sp. XY-223]